MDTLIGPIGPDISNFTRRAEQRLLIIDKTGQILDLITKGSAAFVMDPRRFGKTPHLTTIETIFTRGPDWWKKHCKDLKIVKDHQYSFPVYPVLKLDFSKKTDHLTLKMDIAIQLMKLIEELNLNGKLDWEIRTYQEDYTSDATFFTLFKSTMLEISRKTKKDIAVLINEYDSPIITLAQEILRKSPYDRDLTNNPEMSKLIKFMIQFFALIKELRATEIDGRVCVGFEYISQLGLFSGANDVYVVRHDPIYYDIIGYTEKEILTAFSAHIHNAASKLLSEAKTKKTQEDSLSQDENTM